MNGAEKYKVYYYRNSQNKKVPVFEYVKNLSRKDRAKVATYIAMLRDFDGKLDEPYSRYISSGIRELRVELSRNRHRIFYVTVEEKRIILLHAFLKDTQKTPEQEINRALNNFADYKINKQVIEYEK